VSIALVLFSHLAGTRGFPVSTASGNFWALGELGVRVFFVISGFLITGLLLDELERAGHINLGRFYLRRTLRIFPPYYAFLLVAFVAAAMGRMTLSPHDLIHAGTYTSNYYSNRSWFVGHTWSLSVEEQFYLLWPAVLLLAGTRRAFVGAALLVAASPFIRLGEWELWRAGGAGIGIRFETIADSIALGCVLAGLRPRLHQWRAYQKLLASKAFILIPIAGVAANLTGQHPLVAFGVGMTIANIAIALTIDWCVTRPDTRVGRVLNARPLVIVGWLSYSLYLWQQPFLNRSSQSALAAFPLNIVLAVTLAVLSYLLIERPALRLRKRLERRHPAAAKAASAGRGVNRDAALSTDQPLTSSGGQVIVGRETAEPNS
jgi:peptidoglycan/LPS O-acetylase OafA/YrhL